MMQFVAVEGTVSVTAVPATAKANCDPPALPADFVMSDPLRHQRAVLVDQLSRDQRQPLVGHAFPCVLLLRGVLPHVPQLLGSRKQRVALLIPLRNGLQDVA